MIPRPLITDPKAVTAIWEAHLAGDSMTDIARELDPVPSELVGREVTARDIKRVLDQPPPEAIASSPGWQMWMRAVFVPGSNIRREAGQASTEAMVLLFYPPRMSGTAFQKGARQVERLLREADPDVDLHWTLSERFDDPLLPMRLHREKGTPAFRIQGDGQVRRLLDDEDPLPFRDPATLPEPEPDHLGGPA